MGEISQSRTLSGRPTGPPFPEPFAMLVNLSDASKLGSAGDFLMSKALVEDLSSAAGYRKLHQLCEAGHYVVIPAFEVLLDRSIAAGRDSDEAKLEIALRRASAVVNQSKLQMLKALPQGWLAPFGFWRNFTNGHGPTNFARCVLPCKHHLGAFPPAVEA